MGESGSINRERGHDAGKASVNSWLASRGQRAGFEVLKLDIDGFKVDMERIRDIAQLLRLNIKELAVYRTNRGWHVYLLIEASCENCEIVLFQALMGSDPLREAFNYIRVRHLRGEGMEGSRSWNVLFNGKTTYSWPGMAEVRQSREIYDDAATRKLLGVLKDDG